MNMTIAQLHEIIAATVAQQVGGRHGQLFRELDPRNAEVLEKLAGNITRNVAAAVAGALELEE